MKKLAVATSLLFALDGPALAQSATVKVINQTKWEIHHMFLPATTAGPAASGRTEKAV